MVYVKYTFKVQKQGSLIVWTLCHARPTSGYTISRLAPAPTQQDSHKPTCCIEWIDTSENSEVITAFSALVVTNSPLYTQKNSPFKNHHVLEIGFFMMQHFLHLKTHRLAWP